MTLARDVDVDVAIHRFATFKFAVVVEIHAGEHVCGVLAQVVDGDDVNDDAREGACVEYAQSRVCGCVAAVDEKPAQIGDHDYLRRPGIM